jgi:hypothetical protein
VLLVLNLVKASLPDCLVSLFVCLFISYLVYHIKSVTIVYYLT